MTCTKAIGGIFDLVKLESSGSEILTRGFEVAVNWGSCSGCKKKIRHGHPLVVAGLCGEMNSGGFAENCRVFWPENC